MQRLERYKRMGTACYGMSAVLAMTCPPALLAGGQLHQSSSLSSGISFRFTDSPGTRRLPSAQSPRSISLQRSEQKGRNLFSGTQVFSLPQLGQTIFFMEAFFINYNKPPKTTGFLCIV